MISDPEQIRALLLSFLRLRRVACFPERHAPTEYYKPERAVTCTQIATGTKKVTRFVCVDVDGNPHGPFCAEEAGLPPPHFIMASPSDPTSVHLIYALAFMVRHDTPRERDLLKAVLKALALAVPGGDTSYRNARVRSPCSPDWRSYIDERAPAEGYSLSELASQLDIPGLEKRPLQSQEKAILPAPEKKPQPGREKKLQPPQGEGRNVTLFDHLRAFCFDAAKTCGMEIQLRRELELEAERVNAGFSVPLSRKELASVVRSVARFEWKYHIEVARPAFVKKQAARGRKSGAVRSDAADAKASRVLELRAAGLTWAQVAAETGWPAETCRKLALR